MLKRISLSLLAAMTVTTAAQAETIFVDNATIATQTSRGTVEGSDIIIKDGIVLQIGTELTAPDGATIVEGDKLYVTPGFFAPFSHVGLVDVSLEKSTNDIRSGEAVTSASESAADSFNPKAAAIANTRIEGITRIGAVPTSTHHIIAGTGLIANTSGRFTSIENEAAFLFIRLGEDGANIAGGSRAAALAQFRAALNDGLSYPTRFREADNGDTLSRFDAAAMVSAARGQVPIMIEADRASDILRIVKLKRDYGRLNIIIVGAAEAWMITEQVKAAGLKLLIDPHDNLPDNFEQLGARADHAALLADANIPFSFMTRTANLSHNIRVLPQHAGNAVAEGLAWEKAIAAMTTVPLSWFGLQRSGQIRSGAAANLVVWDGDPLEVTSSPTHIYIDGEQQSLESRQTALRDRYNPLNLNSEAHKYR